MFASYPTYSMAILWNMNALDLNLRASLFGGYDGGFPDVPVDGDALARSTAARRKNDQAWANLAADVLDRLNTNAADSDKVA